MPFQDIYKLGCLVDLRIHYWDGMTRLLAEDMGVEKDDVPNSIKFGKKRLVPDARIAPVLNKARDARKQLEIYGLHWPWGRGRFVLLRHVPELFSKLEEVFSEFEAEVEAFLLDYETYPLRMRPDWTAAALQAYRRGVTSKHSITNGYMRDFLMRMKEGLPDIEELRFKYSTGYLITNVVPISVPGSEVDLGSLVQEVRDHLVASAHETASPMPGSFRRLAAHLRTDRKRITYPMAKSPVFAMQRHLQMEYYESEEVKGLLRGLLADLEAIELPALNKSLNARLTLAKRLDDLAPLVYDRDAVTNKVMAVLDGLGL